jgi:hypothetical protein
MSNDWELTPEEARRELRYRMETEGAQIAYDTAVGICRDPKASATAKASAVNSLLRVGGYDGKPEPDTGKAISDMTPAELKALLARTDVMLARYEAQSGDQNDVFD